MVTRIIPRIRVVLVDTGYLFPETLDFMQSLHRRFDLNLLIYKPAVEPEEYLRASGESDSSRRNDVQACCRANKNEPFDRALRELSPGLAAGNTVRSIGHPAGLQCPGIVCQAQLLCHLAAAGVVHEPGA